VITQPGFSKQVSRKGAKKNQNFLCVFAPSSETIFEQKSAAVFAVRRANYTHRRKGVFNVQSIEDLRVRGNVRSRTAAC
jgi:hypothetical protein